MANDIKKNVDKGIMGTIVGAVSISLGTIIGKLLAANLNLDSETELAITGAVSTLVSGLALGLLNYNKNRGKK